MLHRRKTIKRVLQCYTTSNDCMYPAKFTYLIYRLRLMHRDSWQVSSSRWRPQGRLFFTAFLLARVPQDSSRSRRYGSLLLLIVSFIWMLSMYVLPSWPGGMHHLAHFISHGHHDHDIDCNQWDAACKWCPDSGVQSENKSNRYSSRVRGANAETWT